MQVDNVVEGVWEDVRQECDKQQQSLGTKLPAIRLQLTAESQALGMRMPISLSFRGRVHDVLPRLYAGRRISELAASWAATRPVQGDLNPADAICTIVDTRAQIKAIQVRRYGLLLLLAHERSEWVAASRPISFELAELSVFSTFQHWTVTTCRCAERVN